MSILGDLGIAIKNKLALKANIASPTFTGVVTAPTFSGSLSGIATAGYTGYGKIGVIGQIGMNCASADTISARGLQFFIDGIKHGNLSVDNYDNLLYIGNGIGYATGSGGTVTQLTSKSTAVTLNKPTGQITMNNAALAAGASVAFSFSNILLTNTDTLVVGINGALAAYYTVTVGYYVNGFCAIYVTNRDTGSRSEAIVINYTVIKGANA